MAGWLEQNAGRLRKHPLLQTGNKGGGGNVPKDAATKPNSREHGFVVTREFYKKVDAQGLPCVGWLTFLRDPRTMALRNDVSMKNLIIETVDGDHGTLIILDRSIVSPDNTEQLKNARLLLSKLIAEKLIQA